MISFYRLKTATSRLLDKIKKDDWRQVKTLSTGYMVTETQKRYGYVTDKSECEGIVYYHLFESRKGKRKCVIECSTRRHTKLLQEDAKGFDVYQKTIFRWQNGRVDPSIPRYNDIPEEETMTVLKNIIS